MRLPRKPGIRQFSGVSYIGDEQKNEDFEQQPTPTGRADSLSKIARGSGALPSTSIGAPGAWARKGFISGGLRTGAAFGDFIKPIVASRREKLIAERAAAAKDLVHQRQVEAQQAKWDRDERLLEEKRLYAEERQQEEWDRDDAQRKEDKKHAIILERAKAAAKGGGNLSKDMPEGVETLPDGTQRAIRLKEYWDADKNTSALRVLPMPEGVRVHNTGEKAKERKLGEVQGRAAGALPEIRRKRDQFVALATDILKSGEIDKYHGAITGRKADVTPGALAAKARLDRLGEMMFTTGFEMAKGGGAITNIEGERFKNALFRKIQAGEDPEVIKKVIRDGIATIEGLVLSKEITAGTIKDPTQRDYAKKRVLGLAKHMKEGHFKTLRSSILQNPQEYGLTAKELQKFIQESDDTEDKDDGWGDVVVE